MKWIWKLLQFFKDEVTEQEPVNLVLIHAKRWSDQDYFEANFLVGDDGEIFGKEDEQTMNGLVEEFHEYLASHGHAPGSDVIPGSRSAARAVESAFKTSAAFRRKHDID